MAGVLELVRGPWVRLGESWVTPSLLRRVGDFWQDPAEYLYPYQELEPAAALVVQCLLRSE